MASNRRFLLLLVLLLWMPVGLHAQSAPGEPVVLEGADSLVSVTVGGVVAQQLVGHVRLRQGTLALDCNRAVFYQAENRVTLSGDVHVVRDEVTLTADDGAYDGNRRVATFSGHLRLDDGRVVLTSERGDYALDPKRATASGNVHLVQQSDGTTLTSQTLTYDRPAAVLLARGRPVTILSGATTVTADSLRYEQTPQRTEAVGAVRITNPKQRAVLTGGFGEYRRPTAYSRLTRSPRLEQIDTSAAGRRDTLILTSAVMEAFQDTTRPRRFVATDAVVLTRGDLVARGKLAVYALDRQQIFLTADSAKRPIAWYGRTQVTGDSITVGLAADRSLESVVVTGEPLAMSRTDSVVALTVPARPAERFDQLGGKTLTMRFGGSRLAGLEMVGEAVSLYHRTERDSAGHELPAGANKASGDRIRLGFDDATGSVATIRVIGDPEGTLVPETMRRDLDLPGAVWRGPERPDIRTRLAPADLTAPATKPVPTKPRSKPKPPRKHRG